jgi:hypothetical protein
MIGNPLEDLVVEAVTTVGKEVQQKWIAVRSAKDVKGADSFYKGQLQP